MKKIIKWEPFPEEKSKRFYCEGVHDDYEGFRILIKNDETSAPMLRLSFENALLYQNRDESYYFHHPNMQGEFEFPHPFYLLENSDLISEFHSGCSEIYRDWDIKHFAIYTCNDCIDVLSVNEPKAENLSE